jgi:hypothetical protein
MEEDVSVNHVCFLFSWPLFDFLLLLLDTPADMYILPDTRLYSMEITMPSQRACILSRIPLHLLEIVAVCRGMLQSLQQQANWDVRERKYVDTCYRYSSNESIVTANWDMRERKYVDGEAGSEAA